MARYKNMTNRPLPIQLTGKGLSVGARGEFEVVPQEISAQLLFLVKQGTVRCIVPDPVPESKPEEPKKGYGYTVPSKMSDKDNDSLTFGQDSVKSIEEKDEKVFFVRHKKGYKKTSHTDERE